MYDQTQLYSNALKSANTPIIAKLLLYIQTQPQGSVSGDLTLPQDKYSDISTETSITSTRNPKKY
jgi:hypothetical protein